MACYLQGFCWAARGCWSHKITCCPNLLLPGQLLYRSCSCWRLNWSLQSSLNWAFEEPVAATSSCGRIGEPTCLSLGAVPPISQRLMLPRSVFQVSYNELELNCNWKNVLENKHADLETVQKVNKIKGKRWTRQHLDRAEADFVILFED